MAKNKYIIDMEDLEEVGVLTARDSIADNQLRAYVFYHACSEYSPDDPPEAMIFITPDLDSAKKEYLEHTMVDDGYINWNGKYLRKIVEKPLSEGLFYDLGDLMDEINSSC